MKPAEHPLRGARMVVLHPLRRQPHVPEVIDPVCLHEEPAIVTQNLGNNDNNLPADDLPSQAASISPFAIPGTPTDTTACAIGLLFSAPVLLNHTS